MADPTNREIAYQLIGLIAPLGAQWADLDEAIATTHSLYAVAALKRFGEQLAPLLKIAREAATRLDEDVPADVRLCPECKNPMVHFEADAKAKSPAMWVCTHAACDYCEPHEELAA